MRSEELYLRDIVEAVEYAWVAASEDTPSVRAAVLATLEAEFGGSGEEQ